MIGAIYRAIVRRKVIDSFAHLSRGDASRALALMSPTVRYTFEGTHALGGTRATLEGVKRWFDRLLRLLPGRFAIRRVEVIGWPWRTTVFTTFEDSVTPAFGPPYLNQGVQVVELRWGLAVRIHTYVDTGKVERALRVLAENGVSEAGSGPLTDS